MLKCSFEKMRCVLDEDGARKIVWMYAVLSCPALPGHTLHLPHPAPPCHTMPYPTLFCLTLPYPTLPYRTLPYLSLPYLTLPIIDFTLSDVHV